MNPLARTALLQPVLGFIALCALIAFFGLAHASHLIDAADWQRSLGQIVSLMLLVMGNFLPKLRPLQGCRMDRSEGAAAERFAGQAMLLAGLISFMLFIALPWSEARLAAAWLGVGTFTMIATQWSWLAYSAAPLTAGETRPAAEVRTTRMAVWLLFGYAYICGSVWALNLLGDGPARDEARVWLLTGFAMLISVVFPLVEGYPRARCAARMRAE
jgi:hypothetical protein